MTMVVTRAALRFGIVVAILAMASCAPTADDGETGDEDLRGGVAAPDPALLAVGALGYIDQGDVFRVSCTGTLIDRDHVITAKHCVTSDPEGGELDRMEGLQFVVGPNAKSGTRHRVARARASDYREGGFIDYGADVAVLKLETAPANVAPIPVAEGHLGAVHVGERMTVVGYGFDGLDRNGVRRKGSVTVRAVAGIGAQTLWSTRAALDADVVKREKLPAMFGADDDRAAQVQRFYEHPLLDGAELYVGGATTDAQPCRADSGGPVLRNQRVVGVVSGSLKLSSAPCGRYGAFVASIGEEAQRVLRDR
jgi:hypothetical protein